MNAVGTTAVGLFTTWLTACDCLTTDSSFTSWLSIGDVDDFRTWRMTISASSNGVEGVVTGGVITVDDGDVATGCAGLPPLYLRCARTLAGPANARNRAAR